MSQEPFRTAIAAGSRTLWELVFDRASWVPDALAMIAPGRDALTFGELKVHIIAMSAALNAEGIGRNDRVALALPNGPEMATAFLAIACCATCAPLNPEQTHEEFEFVLKDLQPRALIVAADSNSCARAVARRLEIQVIEIDLSGRSAAGLFTLSGAAARPPYAARTLARADDVALLLCTSGTTGRPKRVPLTHANLCASARNIAGSLQLIMAACERMIPVQLPASRLTPGTSGCLGVGIPYAIAAKLVHPERPVVAICGDFAFSLTRPLA